MVKKFTEYITERLGVVESTLPYIEVLSNFIFNKTIEFHKMYSDSDDKKIIKEYHKRFKKTDFNVDANSWKDFPVDFIEVISTYSKRYDGRYMTDPKGKFVSSKVGGACYAFAEGNEKEASKVIKVGKDRSLKLKFDMSCAIWKSFDEKDYDYLLAKIKSVISHELNHAYENWKRKKNKATPLSYTMTTASYMKNKMNFDKSVWNFWLNNFLDLIYQIEPHELNAHSQEVAEFIKDSGNNLESYKEKFPNSYSNIQNMLNFNADDFIKKLSTKIKRAYQGEVDVQYVQNTLKKLFIDQVQIVLKDFKNETSRYNINALKKMSFEEFVSYFGKKFNEGGERLMKAVGRAIVNK
mgnify:CR=1 FL=1